MPAMLSASVLEARRVDVTSTASKTPIVLTAPVHREALAKLIDSHDFHFSFGDTWRAYRGDCPAGSQQGNDVLEIVTSNRNSPVEFCGLCPPKRNCAHSANPRQNFDRRVAVAW